MAWFNGHKKAIDARVASVECDVIGHTTSIAVVQSCQENTRQRLDEICETTRDTNQSLKELSQTITQLALWIKK